MTQKDPAACSKGKVVALARALIAQASNSALVGNPNASITAPNGAITLVGGSTGATVSVDANGVAINASEGSLDLTQDHSSIHLGVGDNDDEIHLASAGGVVVGYGTGQKVAFFNASPVAQPSGVADAAGGVVIDAEARAALNSLITKLESLGIIATV